MDTDAYRALCDLLGQYPEWRLRLAKADAKLGPWRDEQDLTRSEDVLVTVLKHEYEQVRGKSLELQVALFVA